MMRFVTLGSGSSGNSSLICAGGTRILIDAGFSIKETVKRLQEVGVNPQEITAILVTHEHGDHLSGVAPFARRYPTSVWMTHGTYQAAKDKKIQDLNLIHASECFSVGELQVEACPTPHDAVESCQFIFSYQQVRFALMTDLGCTSVYLQKRLSNLDALLLECNYDADMLRRGPYGPSLQTRIRGDYGHLDNCQSAHFLKAIDSPRLKNVLLGHLSEKNNSTQAVMDAFTEIVPNALDRLTVLKQAHVSEWFLFEPQNERIVKNMIDSTEEG